MLKIGMRLRRGKIEREKWEELGWDEKDVDAYKYLQRVCKVGRTRQHGEWVHDLDMRVAPVGMSVAAAVMVVRRVHDKLGWWEDGWDVDYVSIKGMCVLSTRVVTTDEGGTEHLAFLVLL